jgi:tripartite-type tricarboxylate transporter receptor subunit TctC
MSNRSKRRRCANVLLTIAALLGFFVSGANAQSYPDRPIKLILPFVAGTPNDVIARLLSQPLSLALKQPVIVENRPGGATTIGPRDVAKSDPDGYTLLVTAPNHVIAPAEAAEPPYDPIKDFKAVASVATAPWILVASPNLPVHSLPELIAYAHANPGKLTIGFGKGTSPELVAEMFKVATKSQINSVPYKGGAQVLTDILAGVIDLNFNSVGVSLPLIKDGKLQALAVTSDQRMPELPNVPTLKESGITGLASVTFWTGILAPARTPDAIVKQLNMAINDILSSPDFRTRLLELSFKPYIETPEEFAAFLVQEQARWQTIVKSTGVTMN